MNRIFASRALGLGVLSLLALAGCGGSSSERYSPPTLSHGVVFTYPINGQSDVPLGTRFYVTFSKAVSNDAVVAGCSVDGSGNVTGNFCLVDANDNVVAITPTVSGKVVQFETDQLRQGSRYRLFVRSAVIGESRTNLPADDPLLTFTTSQIDPLAGVIPRVTAINGEDPDAYLTLPVPPAQPPATRYPFMDFSTVRVEFSEPLDEKTVQVGSSFEFVEVVRTVDPDTQVVTETEEPVVGALIVRKQHVSFDPDEDLTPGATYRLRLSSAIRDRNGEALSGATYELVPVASNDCNCVITEHFNTIAAFGEPGFPATSSLTGRPLNTIDLYSPLIGENDIHLLDSTLQIQLADPSRFGGLIPFVIRRGNFLDITGLDLQLGGAVAANLQTGDIKATFLTDATGFMGRNPFRSASTLPDDDKSPVYVYLIFDLALSGTDAKGNAVLNQTIPHVQATGIAKAVNGQLQIQTVRTLTMDLLGLDLAPAHMVLGIHSERNLTRPQDTEAPRLTGAYPADGSDDFPLRDGLSLIFSEAIDNAGVVANDQIRLFDVTANALVPFQLTYDGSTVLLKPDSPLEAGHDYTITLDALTDLSENHNLLALDVSDASGGDGVIAFRTENPLATAPVGPLVTSIAPGVACALTGTTQASPGHCVGGQGGDTNYQPFTVAEDGYLEVQFNQPMNLDTLVLGSECNSGRVRVERWDDTGTTCLSVVAGSLIAETRGFRFIPSEPWTVGAQYRLTLVGGMNATCDSASEICGSNGRPLNTDPLNGATASSAGGADIVSRFSVIAANDDVFLPLKLEPYADINGNGFLDAGETAREENSAAVSITGWSGIVTSASLIGDNKLYLNGTLPVTVGQPEPLTVDGAIWDMTLRGDSQIPVQINPGVLYGTSITMASAARVTALFIPIDVAIENTNTGLNILRLRESSGPITGYIVEEEGQDQPQFIGQLDLYMDAPDMVIRPDSDFLNSLSSVSHDLVSKPLTAIVKGPVTFQEDGRIVIEQSNVAPIDIVVNVTAVVPLSPLQMGAISLHIPAHAMKLRLIGTPLKGRR